MRARAGVLVVASLALAACCGPEVQVLRHDPRGKLDECTHFVVLATVLEGESSGVVAATTTASTASTATENTAGADPATGLVADDLGRRPWVYVTPCWPGILSPEVEAAWRPPTTRGGLVADIDLDAPGAFDGARPSESPFGREIRSALDAARAVLEARGLRPLERATPREERVIVVGVSISSREVAAPRGHEGTQRYGLVPIHRRLARVAVHAGSVLDGKFVRDLTSLAAVYPEECAPDAPFEDEVARRVARLVKALPH